MEGFRGADVGRRARRSRAMDRIDKHTTIRGRESLAERSTTAYWDRLAQRGGPITAVIDPRDCRGLKNLYIDTAEDG